MTSCKLIYAAFISDLKEEISVLFSNANKSFVCLLWNLLKTTHPDVQKYCYHIVVYYFYQNKELIAFLFFTNRSLSILMLILFASYKIIFF